MSVESVTLVPKKIKSVTLSIDSPSICHEVTGPGDIIYSMDMSLSKCWELVMGREACILQSMALQSQTWLSFWTELNWFGNAIQPSHSLSSPSPPAFNHSQYQGLFQWQSWSLDTHFPMSHSPGIFGSSPVIPDMKILEQTLSMKSLGLQWEQSNQS